MGWVTAPGGTWKAAEGWLMGRRFSGQKRTPVVSGSFLGSACGTIPRCPPLPGVGIHPAGKAFSRQQRRAVSQMGGGKATPSGHRPNPRSDLTLSSGSSATMPAPLFSGPFGTLACCTQHLWEPVIGSEAICLVVFTFALSFEMVLMFPRLASNSL